MKTLSTTSNLLLSSTAVLNSFRRATCTLQLTDRAKERKTAVAIFLETKSDLTKAIWRVFRLMSDMASSLNTTPSGSKGATPSSSSLNRLSTASNEGKAEGSKLRNANPSQYVKLNVGGSLHYTTIGTLTKVGDFDHDCVLLGSCYMYWSYNVTTSHIFWIVQYVFFHLFFQKIHFIIY